MKTRLAGAPFLALALAAGLGGCASDRSTVQLQALCYPTSDCTFADTCDTVYGGYAGISGAGTLVLFIQVSNNLPNNRNIQIGRLNTNDAHIDEIQISYSGAQTNTQTTGGNSYVPAGGSTVVPLALGITGAGEILANVRMRGYYDDGRSFETGDFPISIWAAAGVCGTTTCTTFTCPPGASLKVAEMRRSISMQPVSMGCE